MKIPKFLYTAARNGSVKLIESILKKGEEPGSTTAIDINETDERHYTLLFEAVVNNQLEVVKFLLSQPNIDPNITDANSYSPLMCADRCGFLDIVKVLLKDKRVNIHHQQNDKGWTALMFAAANDKVDVMAELLADPRVNKDFKTKDEETALSIARKYKKTNAYKLLGGVPISQAEILKKCNKYLAIQAKIHPSKYNKQDLENLFAHITAGQCNGLSGLWLYRKSEGDEEQLLSSLRVISEWNEDEESLKEGNNFLGKLFESLINDMRWVQDQSQIMKYTITQQDLVDTLAIANPITINKKTQKITEHIGLRKEFGMAFVFKQQELSELLKSIVKNEKMIRIYGPNHAVGVMLKDGKYTAYDPNDMGGELEFPTIEKLQEYIEATVIKDLGFSVANMPLTINVFDYSNKPDTFYEKTPVAWAEHFIKKNNDANRSGGMNFNSLFMAAKSGDAGMVRYLLSLPAESNIDINQVTSTSSSPLFAAAHYRHPEVLFALLKDPRINIHSKDLNNSNIVNYVAEHGLVDIFPLLLQFPNLDLNNKSGTGSYTPLIMAVQNRQIEMIKMLIKQGRISINEVDSQQRTAVHHAIFQGDVACLQTLLLNENLDLNKADFEGNTPLLLATGLNKTEHIKVLLKDKRVNKNVSNNIGNSLFILMCEKGDLEIVKMLLNDPDIDLNKRDGQGRNALMRAVFAGQTEVVKILLDSNKFNLLTPDNNGHTALDMAISTNNYGIIPLLTQSKDISDELCLEKINYYTSNSNIAMSHAIALGKKIDLEGSLNRLMLLIIQGDLLSIKKLLASEKIDVNQLNFFGFTPLICATVYNKKEIVEYLLTIPELKLDIKGKDDKTVLDFAGEQETSDISELLFKTNKISNQSLWERLNKVDLDDEAFGYEINKLIKKLPLDDSPSFQNFMLSVMKGDLETVKKIVDSNIVDINQTTQPNGASALLWAIFLGHNKVAQYLMNLPNFDLAKTDQYGDTALIFAAADGDLEMVDALIKHPNIALNHQNDNDYNALMIAAENGNVKVVEKLLERNDHNLDLTNDDGENARWLAAREGHLKIVKLLKKPKVKIEVPKPAPLIFSETETEEDLLKKTAEKPVSPKTLRFSEKAKASPRSGQSRDKDDEGIKPE